MARRAPFTATAPMTAEQLYDLPDDGMQYELVRGQLRVMEPPGAEHGWLAVRLGARLLAFVEARGLGAVFVESGYVLERGPDTVRGPDITFVRTDRLPSADRWHCFVEGAPDLAVEIRSPRDRRGEMEEKVGEYFAAGTSLVWVVDPARRSIAVRRPDGGDVLPGFSLPLAELFARPAPGA